MSAMVLPSTLLLSTILLAACLGDIRTSAQPIKAGNPCFVDDGSDACISYIAHMRGYTTLIATALRHYVVDKVCNSEHDQCPVEAPPMCTSVVACLASQGTVRPGPGRSSYCIMCDANCTQNCEAEYCEIYCFPAPITPPTTARSNHTTTTQSDTSTTIQLLTTTTCPVISTNALLSNTSILAGGAALVISIVVNVIIITTHCLCKRPIQTEGRKERVPILQERRDPETNYGGLAHVNSNIAFSAQISRSSSSLGEQPPERPLPARPPPVAIDDLPIGATETYDVLRNTPAHANCDEATTQSTIYAIRSPFSGQILVDVCHSNPPAEQPRAPLAHDGTSNSPHNI